MVPCCSVTSIAPSLVNVNPNGPLPTGSVMVFSPSRPSERTGKTLITPFARPEPPRLPPIRSVTTSVRPSGENEACAQPESAEPLSSRVEPGIWVRWPSLETRKPVTDGSWPVEQFSKFGVRYEQAAKPRRPPRFLPTIELP